MFVSPGEDHLPIWYASLPCYRIDEPLRQGFGWAAGVSPSECSAIAKPVSRRKSSKVDALRSVAKRFAAAWPSSELQCLPDADNC